MILVCTKCGNQYRLELTTVAVREHRDCKKWHSGHVRPSGSLGAYIICDSLIEADFYSEVALELIQQGYAPACQNAHGKEGQP